MLVEEFQTQQNWESRIILLLVRYNIYRILFIIYNAADNHLQLYNGFKIEARAEGNLETTFPLKSDKLEFKSLFFTY